MLDQGASGWEVAMELALEKEKAVRETEACRKTKAVRQNDAFGNEVEH